MSASATSWKREPFKEGVPLPYDATFDGGQFARLKRGLIPDAMEDKWFIYFEEPHLFFHRSWTGQPVYRLALTLLPDGAAVTETLLSKDLVGTLATTFEEEARLLDFLVSNLLLGQAKPFPMPAGQEDPAPGVIQHVFSGTDYPQLSGSGPLKSLTTPKKPWWRIW